MELKEFSNPESKDYDINSSLNYNSKHNYNASSNPYSEQLIDLIGILEDVTEEELQEQYGISEAEYLNPTSETIKKVEDRLNSCQKHI